MESASAVLKRFLPDYRKYIKKMDLLRSLPIGLYLEHPFTWLHRLDPRVKLAWLLSFLLSPILANSWYRLWVVAVLILLTFVGRIPKRVWWQQLGLLLLFCLLIFALTLLLPDEMRTYSQPRITPDLSLNLPLATDYRYKLLDLSLLGDKFHLSFTRHSLYLAVGTSTFLFTAIYSSTLYLLTTAPEEITAGLEELLAPLARLKIPVTEITLTLTLALRFVPLVMEEVQNLIRSIRTRAINWQKLGWKNSLKIWLIVVERLIENLLVRAQQISMAIDVRGFTSPNEHRVLWHSLKLTKADWLVLAALILFWMIRLFWGRMS